jgi:hypothetical protein
MYGYGTLGGPFLADLKTVHSRFGIRNLLSIEGDKTVYDRQKFNQSLSLIKCKNMLSADFVTNFDEISSEFNCDNWALWLDYVSPAKREQQLSEVAGLVGKLSDGDIIRVTLNAALHPIAVREAYDSASEFQQDAFIKLKAQLGRYFPSDQPFSAEDMTLAGIARILASAARLATLEGLAGQSLRLHAVPLCSFRYSDGPHQMLTTTAAIVEDVEGFLTATDLLEWPYYSDKWENVREISIPDLSVKEKIAIDELIFTGTADDICSALPFKLDFDKSKSKRMVASYIEHYLRYPNFLQVVV